MTRDNDDLKTSDRPLFAFTAAEGMFPGADGISEFWERILTAEAVEPTRLDTRWGLNREAYTTTEEGIPNSIYLDKAFCLPEAEEKEGAQIRYGRDVLKRLARVLPEPVSFEHTALVLGTSWSDQGYYSNDIEARFHGKDYFDRRYSPDEQLHDLAASISLGGPMLAVDTACASTLYAVETAVGLICSGQARSAVIMGLNVGIPPFLMSAFSQLMALSPDGKSLPFSKDASGMVPGEAVAAVFMEPLSDALAAGREILGVLCSAGLSSDGVEGSVFAPGALGQKHTYERAYRFIDPSGVNYIEAHGTATMLGDKTELQGIHDFFGPHLGGDRHIPVGSVKGLVGHSLAAAGISSLIKALLMLRHRTIPPHIDVLPSPVLEKACVHLPRSPRVLETDGRPMRIGVSSFGFGGSNAHLVLESYDAQAHGSSVQVTDENVLFPDMAIVDMEAGFGDMLTVDRLQPDFYTKTEPCDFPETRFGHTRQTRLRGHFYPDHITIDAKGLKFGPKIISRIDALQNHAVHLTHNLVKRHPELMDDDHTAVTLAMNTGGLRSFQVVRKYHADYRADEGLVDKLAIPETTLEDIGSGLGSMFSGYPAYHFNFKGFHQTCSGDTRTFWNILCTAGLMLRSHCRSAIAGGGHVIKTPVDLCDPRLNTDDPPTVLEGTALFLLKRMDMARKDGDRMLAVIDAVIPSSKADTFEKACALAGVAPASVDIRACSQLDPCSNFRQEHGRRFAGEATGSEVLCSVLLKEGKRATIEVYDGETLCFTVFLQKFNRLETVEQTLTLHVKVPVSDHPPYMKTQAAPALKEMDQAGLRPDSADGHQTLSMFKTWQETTAKTVQCFLRTQARAVLFKQTTAPNRDMPKDIPSGTGTLADIVQGQEGDVFSARLTVDESHPYFFDHPLDHVPGILILQGALELFDVMAKARFAGDLFVCGIDIKFTKLCEKSTPVRIQLSPLPPSPDGSCSFRCDVAQNDQALAVLNLGAGRISRYPDLVRTIGTAKADPFNDPSVLHKHRAENVLVSDFKRQDGCFVFDLVAPPQGHVLTADGKGMLSMLYILETARQCGMILLHRVLGIPLGSPMILLSLSLTLSRPLYDDGGLRIEHPEPRDAGSTQAVMGSMEFSLYDSKGLAGTCTLSTLVVR
jgi:3-oxoacyl-(acyl-carrier-protein) synthase